MSDPVFRRRDPSPSPKAEGERYDIVVVGAGPVGCAAAAAFARRGFEVLLVEANPKVAHRFAGEWIHPSGVEVLRRLDLIPAEAVGEHDSGQGFVVVPDDGTDPIVLRYADQRLGLSGEHGGMIDAIRNRVVHRRGVTYLPYTRVVTSRESAGGEYPVEVDLQIKDGAGRKTARTVVARYLVGADGRGSIVRRDLGEAKGGQTISHMAGIELLDVDVPFEGFGHVLLGGPGPVLLYRIAKSRARVCIDVPPSFPGAQRNKRFLWDAFSETFGRADRSGRLREAFREALQREPVAWAANAFRPRCYYGRGRRLLVGDAVGYFHPMTAAGISMGLGDVVALTDALTDESAVLASYQARRDRESYLPELLSNALYQVFVRDDVSASSIRSSVFEAWRRNPKERRRTMRFLSGEETRLSEFGAAFINIAGGAAMLTATHERGRGPRAVASRLASFGEWVQWPAASLLPARLRHQERPRSDARAALSAFRQSASSSDEIPRGSSVAAVELLARIDDVIEAVIGDVTDRVRIRSEAERGDHATLSLLLLLPVPVRSVSDVSDAVDCTAAADAAAADTEAARDLVRSFARGASLRAPLIEPREAALALLALVNDVAGAELLELAAVLAGRVEESLNDILELPSAQTLALGMEALSEFRKVNPGLFVEEIEGVMAAGRERIFEALSSPKHASFDHTSLQAAWLRAAVAAGTSIQHPSVRRTWRSGTMREAAQPDAALALLSAVQSPDWNGIAEVLSQIEDFGVVEALSSAIGQSTDGEGVMRLVVLMRSLVATRIRLHSSAAIAQAKKATSTTETRSALGRATVSTISTTSATTIGNTMEHESADWDFCLRSLKEVSRSFSRPIEMLPGELRTAVTCGYLLCRIVDSVEDNPNLTLAHRDELYALFLEVVEHDASAAAFSERFEGVPGPEHEMVLVADLERVMRVFRTLPTQMQTTTRAWVAEMARGMQLYSHRPSGADGYVALHTSEDLERYCYFVAGTVGHMLTDLFVAWMAELSPGQELGLRKDAEAFGLGLQLTNILKDVTDDRERKTSFVPRSACAEAGVRIASLVDPENREAAHRAVAPLFDIAENKLKRAFDYCLAIPSEHREVRLFCLLPLWMAARTLVLARGNDAMFVAGEPVKISREEVESLILDCVENVGRDEVLRERYDYLWSLSKDRQFSAAKPTRGALSEHGRDREVQPGPVMGGV